MKRETLEAYATAALGLCRGIGKLLLEEIKPRPRPIEEPDLPPQCSISYFATSEVSDDIASSN